MSQVLLSPDILFDGTTLHHKMHLLLDGPYILGLCKKPPADVPQQKLRGLLAPGLLDLQVNGGGGKMVGPQTTPDQLLDICSAHLRLGSSAILPTLITDSAQTTDLVLQAGIAIKDHPTFLGLHLEGPHLDPRRKGAHDSSFIRPMEDSDLAMLIAAATQLPALMVTLAPASVTGAQITALSQAGIIVSLGHTEATCAEAEAAFRAGASHATHLFNAMSQMGNREPGLVGAVLSGTAFAGVIADGHHIAPQSLKIALSARDQGLYLVTDAMAVAGTSASDFTLNGRRVLRQQGRLILEDGTLAGADLTLPQAIAYIHQQMGQPLERALAMATSIPAKVLGLGTKRGHLVSGARADLTWLAPDLRLQGLWQAGQQVMA